MKNNTNLLLFLLGLFFWSSLISSLLSEAAPISISSDATFFTCPTDLSKPTQLESFSGGHLLLAPTSQEGDLCILSRVNRNVEKKVYIPIARSYDGNDWHRVQGRYISYVTAKCGEASESGPGYSAGDYLCEISIPMLKDENVGYFVTKWEEKNVSNRRKAARFLEKATWGARWNDIIDLEKEVASQGNKALAQWVKQQQSLPPSSHRVFFRQRLSPRTVESYQYGIPGPKACEKNARFRRFSFTLKDLELSRGNSGYWAGNTGLPFTPVKIETIAVGGVDHYVIKFGEQVRTILKNPLSYTENGATVTLPDGQYTICHVEEFVGNMIGNITYNNNMQFQLLVGDLCTSSYTNRGGVDDGKGDGATSTENIKVGNTLVRMHDKFACDAKCGDASKVKLIQGGNPEVSIPDGFDTTTLSWVDLTALKSSDIVNINTERTHDSSWLLMKSLDNCKDQNGDEFPNPARLANTDYFSTGHGKYNLDKPIFAKLASNKWALHDFRTEFKGNTQDAPLEDGGGGAMKAAARVGANDDNNLVVRCSNVQRNIFNEKSCKISYHPDACSSVPLPDPDNFYRSVMKDPGEKIDHMWKYLRPYAGPDHGGVVICGSENEIPPIPTEDDHFDVTNRKVEPAPIDYESQKTTVWIEVVLAAQDQLCQRLAWGLSKIFATSTEMNADSFNTETNIGVYDSFVTSCFSTYREVMKKVSFNQEMSEQLTFKFSKSVGADWHKTGKLAWPDENYARENLQLHSIGLLKLNEDGTQVLDRFGKSIDNYQQKHIFAAAKVWTSFKESFRRANYEDLDYSVNSYLDPLQIDEDVSQRDWFPKISTDGGYIGDKFPLCTDLPERHFLRKGATFRLLGGSTIPLSHFDPLRWEGDIEVQRMKLHPNSQLYNTLCNPTNAPLPSSTLSSGTGVAKRETAFNAPYCKGSFSSCDSGDLLRGIEDNPPSTVDGCADGKDMNSYTTSITQLKVMTIDGNDLRGGDHVKIEATIISFSKLDRVDFYYSQDAIAASVDWTFITTVAPIDAANTETVVTLPYSTFPDIEYTIPKCLEESGCKQAIRVVLRSSRNPNNPTKAKPRASDGNHKPDSNCATEDFDDTDDLVFDVLPSPRPKDACSFETLVTLDKSLKCHGAECAVSTVRVVEVMPGVFYEYLHVPCVQFPFYSDAVKIFAGFDNTIYMCADKYLASARSTCCGTYPDRGTFAAKPDWADLLQEFRGERLSYAANEKRCTDWGLTICDPEKIAAFTGTTGQCLHRQSCRDSESSDTMLVNNAWHWTTAGCKIQVKIDPEGLLAILHKPEDKWTTAGSTQFPKVQSHVNKDKTMSYFHVQWDTTNIAVGKREYPHVTDNVCDGGEVTGEFCICDVNVNTKAVFDSLPTRAAVLTDLFIGAFDPTVMFEADEYTILIETDADDGVSVYKKSDQGDYSQHTIFRVKGGYHNDYIFLTNVQSTVSVCKGKFFFRNAPTFYDIVDPQVISAYQEVEAYLDYVDGHVNTPPFVCISLLKHFGCSNPSPQQVLDCSNAYKSGKFTWYNPTDSSDTILFGTGVRGDLQAVSASIVLSNDALSATLDSDPTFGGVKEPLHKLMQVMRGLEFTRSLTHRRTDRMISKTAQDIIGQVPYGTPDQFSFFSPDYSPPGAHIESGLVSPESELLNMKYVLASQNSFYALIKDGLSACWGGIGPYWSKGSLQSCGDSQDAPGFLKFIPEGDASSSSNVVAQLATLLTADRLDAYSRELIESAHSSALTAGNEVTALKIAQMLLVSTPNFHATNRAVLSNEARKSTSPASEDKNEPYKAIIHLNLFGAMDSMNMLVPHPDGCPSLYNEYKEKRGQNLHLPAVDLIKIDASTSDQPCASFGINKRLGQALADMYGAGEVVFFANIGHLHKPVTAVNFLTETKTQLFSHHTLEQESFKVDAFHQRDDSGVLGRMTDMLGKRMSTSRIAIDGSSTNLVGDPNIGLKTDVIGGRGPDKWYENDVFGIKPIIQQLNNELKEGSRSIHADYWSQSLIDSKDKSDSYVSMLQTTSDSKLLPSAGLGKQLNMILKMIKLREARGINRDTFALTMDGFDTHFDLKTILHQKFDEIGVALKAFRDELVSLNLWDKITLVVASEMGRTVTPNTSEGTDHGWGGHHFIMGGQLNGTRILGHHPDTYSSDWQYNTGRGAWIPTTPNEAMWFGIAQWFGLDTTDDLSYVLPNMNNFGCRLYSDADLYKGGTGKVPGCGGDVMSFSQVLMVEEPRVLSPDEQKNFCGKIYEAITGISIKCVILDQIIATRERRSLQTSGTHCDVTNLPYTLTVSYEISSDTAGVADSVSDVTNSEVFKKAAASTMDMEVCFESTEGAVPATEFPSMSPSVTASPSKSPSDTYSPSESLIPMSTNPSTSKPPLKMPSDTSSPSKSPNKPPSTSLSMITIEMKSSFKWNINCTPLADETTLLSDAKLVEQALFDLLSSELEENQIILYILVTEMCSRPVPSHTGTVKTNRLLAASDLTDEDVLFTIEISETCEDCGNNATAGESLFNDTKAALKNIVNNGNLTAAIQSGSLDATVALNSASSMSYEVKSPSIPTPSPVKPRLPPSKRPTSKTSKKPSPSTQTLPPVKPRLPSSKRPTSKTPKNPQQPMKPKNGKNGKGPRRKRIPLMISQNAADYQPVTLDIADKQ